MRGAIHSGVACAEIHGDAPKDGARVNGEHRAPSRLNPPFLGSQDKSRNVFSDAPISEVFEKYVDGGTCELRLLFEINPPGLYFAVRIDPLE